MSRTTGGIACPAVVGAPARERQFVTFRLDRWEYGVEVEDVLGIYHAPAVIPTPDEFKPFAGEVRIAAERVPAVNLRELLRLPLCVAPAWLLVVGHEYQRLGLQVDSVCEVIRVPPQAISPLEDAPSSAPAAEFLTAVAQVQGRTVFVINIARLLAGTCG